MKILFERLIVAISTSLLLTVLSCDFLGGGDWPFGWVKSESNPVLPSGQPGEGYRWKQDPAVLYEDGVYKMWFTGCDDDGLSRIYYATSPDGVNWTVTEDAVLEVGAGESWDKSGLKAPTVVKVDGVYHMYFAGHYQPDTIYLLGHATSADGVNWNKDPVNPILSPGQEGECDYYGLSDPTVLYEDGLFKLWYQAESIDEQGYLRLQLALATSSDGSLFSKHPQNPLFAVDEGVGCGGPNVIITEGKYWLFFAEYANGFPYLVGPISVASSSDGVDWALEKRNVLEMGYFGDFDENGVSAPTVVNAGGFWMMWYNGSRYDYAQEDFLYGIGLATR